MLKSYLIMTCYNKFNSYRLPRIAMQEITELFQYAFGRITHRRLSFFNCFI